MIHVLRTPSTYPFPTSTPEAGRPTNIPGGTAGGGPVNFYRVQWNEHGKWCRNDSETWENISQKHLGATSCCCCCCFVFWWLQRSICGLQVNDGKWQTTLATSPCSWRIQPMVIALGSNCALRRPLVVKSVAVSSADSYQNQVLYTNTRWWMKKGNIGILS